MKAKHVIISGIAAAIAACFVISALAEDDDDDQPKLLHKAKVSKENAELTALKKAPDAINVKESELEMEKGKLIWSFGFEMPNTRDITEVNVDAITREIVSVESETAADEAKEAAEDAAQGNKDKEKKEKDDDKD